MKQANHFKLSVTVCIPTYYGGPALVRAVESIRSSRAAGDFRLLVNVDGNPLASDIEQRLKDLDAEVVFSAERGGQVARINQMVGMLGTDLAVLTQDDVVFEPGALAVIRQAFEADPSLTLAGAWIKPLPARGFFEKILEIGTRISHKTGLLWRGGDNYLLASGRCLALRADMAKKLEAPEKIMNSDAYIYFKNKKLGGKFRHLESAVVYNRSPEFLREHLKQAKKFQLSQREISRVLGFDASREYSLPASFVLKNFLREFFGHPLLTLLYAGVHFYTLFAGGQLYQRAQGFWETDLSTKK